MSRVVHVLPHTHWDREWYQPFPVFRLRLVDLIDELIPRLEQDDAFTHFQLDGQMAVVDDYLAVRPEQEERLRALAGAGKLSMGPWYVLPDEFLVSGETLVRDLQLGMSRAGRFGGAMEVGYLPDMFGHIAQMPQLLGLLGFEHAVVWRGVPAAITSPAFWWDAPDGSRVRAEYLPAGYGNGSDLPPDADGVRARIDTFRVLQGPLVGDPILLMAGMDHEVPPPHLTRVIEELNRADADRPDGYRLHIAPLVEYLQKASTDGLPVHRGELRSGARANLLMGVASNRVDVKQAAAKAERALERLAEPMASLWLDRPARWRPLLEGAWLEVIRNAAHDSICACSHDQVGEAVLLRYAEATSVAEGIAERAVTAAAARMADPGTVVLNPTARRRPGVVELEVPGPFPGDPDPDPRLQVLQEHPEVEELSITDAADAPLKLSLQLLGDHPETAAVRFVDAADGVLEAHLLAVPEEGAVDPGKALATVGRRCGSEPELRLRSVLHRARPHRRALTLAPPVPGYGWARWEPTAPSQPVSGVREWGLTNGLVTVEVDPGDGTWSLDGRPGHGRLVDGGDAGDTYNWCPPEHDVVVDAPETVVVHRTEHGPLRGRLVVDATYRLPARVERRAEDDHRRVGEVLQHVRTTLEVHADEPAVRVTVELDHRTRDHRLRVHHPLPERAGRSLAECAYTVVERPLWAEGGPNEWGLPTFPSRRFVLAGGLTLTHEGLCEYELVDLDGPAEDAATTAGELALTLVRATNWLSRGPMPSRPLPAGPDDRLEGAEVLRPLVLRYAVTATAGVDPHELADRVWSPLLAASAPGGGDLPDTGALLGVTGAEVDAVVRDDHDRLVVRVHEPWGRTTTLSITDPATGRPRTGQVVDLRGRPLGAFGGTLELGPHRIVTVRLDG